jgi:hypothetical protein
MENIASNNWAFDFEFLIPVNNASPIKAAILKQALGLF